MEILVGTKTSEAAKRDDFQPLSRSEVKTCQQKASGRLTRLVLPRSTRYWFVVPGLPPRGSPPYAVVAPPPSCRVCVCSAVPSPHPGGIAYPRRVTCPRRYQCPTHCLPLPSLGSPGTVISYILSIKEVEEPSLLYDSCIPKAQAGRNDIYTSVSDRDAVNGT